MLHELFIEVRKELCFQGIAMCFCPRGPRDDQGVRNSRCSGHPREVWKEHGGMEVLVAAGVAPGDTGWRREWGAVILLHGERKEGDWFGEYWAMGRDPWQVFKRWILLRKGNVYHSSKHIKLKMFSFNVTANTAPHGTYIWVTFGRVPHLQIHDFVFFYLGCITTFSNILDSLSLRFVFCSFLVLVPAWKSTWTCIVFNFP